MITYCRGYEKVLVAFSGRVDSILLLHRATTVLGKGNVLAATATSPIRTAVETRVAYDLSALFGIPHRFIPTA